MLDWRVLEALFDADRLDAESRKARERGNYVAAETAAQFAECRRVDAWVNSLPRPD